MPQTAVLATASFERTSISGALGSCGWGMAARANSAIAPALVVARGCHRTLAVLEAPGEKVVPRGKAPVFVLRIVFVLLDADRAPGLGASPAGRRIVEHVERVAAAEETHTRN